MARSTNLDTSSISSFTKVPRAWTEGLQLAFITSDKPSRQKSPLSVSRSTITEGTCSYSPESKECSGNCEFTNKQVSKYKAENVIGENEVVCIVVRETRSLPILTVLYSLRSI